MRVILSGGGEGDQTRSIDSLFFNLVKGGKVIFIPHARSKDEFNNSLLWATKHLFKPFQHNDFEVWSDLNKSISDLSNVSGVIIGGGNTFRLLKELRDTGFIKVLKSFIDNDGIVYGISAGAIVLTKSIITAKPLDENKVKLVNLDGMNLLNNVSVFCHYTRAYDEVILNIIKDNNMSVIGLPEGAGLYLTNNSIMVIGSLPAFLFSLSEKRILSVGEDVSQILNIKLN